MSRLLSVAACVVALLVLAPVPAMAHDYVDCSDAEDCIRHCYHYHHEIVLCFVTHNVKV